MQIIAFLVGVLLLGLILGTGEHTHETGADLHDDHSDELRHAEEAHVKEDHSEEEHHEEGHDEHEELHQEGTEHDH